MNKSCEVCTGSFEPIQDEDVCNWCLAEREKHKMNTTPESLALQCYKVYWSQPDLHRRPLNEIILEVIPLKELLEVALTSHDYITFADAKLRHARASEREVKMWKAIQKLQQKIQL